MVTAELPKDNFSLVIIICSRYVESQALVHGANETNPILLGFQIPALVDGMVGLRHVQPRPWLGIGVIRDLKGPLLLAVDTHEGPVVGRLESPLLVLSIVALIEDDFSAFIGVATAVKHIVLVMGTGDKVPLLRSRISLNPPLSIPPLSITLLPIPLLTIALVVARVVVSIATLAPLTRITPRHCKIC